MEDSINYFKDLDQIVRLSLSEDIGSGDITAQLIAEEEKVSAYVITREPAVVCGRPWFDEVIKQVDGSIGVHWLVKEGDEVSANQKLVALEGNARSILTAERCALNFLQTLMSTATTAKEYASKLEGCNTKILDTRKTLPGLRLAQKYAVKMGGCDNHRIGLFDAFLIKENHIAASGSIAAAIERARQIAPSQMVEVEVESLEELQQAIDADADRIMLDNFSAGQLQKAKELKTSRVEYEISGNITEDALNGLAHLDVDYISSGALTKHVQAIDLSMRIQPASDH